MTTISRYDPLQQLSDHWPEIHVRTAHLRGDLLGEIRDHGDHREIVVRAGTSSGQRRCTLTHELIHLERGLEHCGPWQHREEAAIQLEVARRLIPLDDLLDTAPYHGRDLAGLAVALDVDQETLALRLSTLSRGERTRLEAVTTRAGGHVTEI